MTSAYDYPRYYEIAFDYRDIGAEVDLFEECFARYSKIPVKSVLELASGNSPHMVELVKRGYAYQGLDLNPQMLEYSRRKAAKSGIEADFIQGDLVRFTLDNSVDFVYIMLGSLIVKKTDELKSHFDAVSRVLRRGGLYLLDWCIQYDSPFEAEGGGSWRMEREGVSVGVNVSWKAVDRVQQTFEERIVLSVNDNGKELEISGTDLKRAIYPQEFLLFVAARKDFEFVGWWNKWDFEQPLEQQLEIDRPIALLRRI